MPAERPVDNGSVAEPLPNVFTFHHLLGFLAYIAGCLRVSIAHLCRYVYKVLTFQRHRQQYY
jgi:hypothetical protein